MNKEYRLPPTIKELLQADCAQQDICIKAWVRSKRESKNVSFLNINDGSSPSGIQVVLADEALAQNDLSLVDNGASVACYGDLVASNGKEQSWELQASKVELIGASPAEDYPLQKKRHSFEFLREIAHLRGRSNSIGATMRIRNTLSYLVHQFFQERGFFYIHTPIITTSDAEGAGEMFNVESESYQKEGRNFFGQPSFLTVSGQLEGEVYAHSHSRIYTFGPTFRAEESNTARHLAEFWMIEPEVAFCDINDLMELAEAFIRYLISGVLEQCSADLELLNRWIEPELISSLQSVVSSSEFVRISYTEAIEKLKASGESFEYKVEWGEALQTEHERWLSEVLYKAPLIVYNYPAEGKAFYMKQNEDGKTVRGMDLLVPRLGEIIGGSEREDNYDKLLQRMLTSGMEIEHYQWYLDLRRFGGTPHSGFGLGFERMVQYCTGMKNIRDVIPYPRAVGQAY